MISYSTRRQTNAKITVGVLRDGEKNIKIYGKDGRELPFKEHIYEIASITKSFTGAIFAQLVMNGKLCLYETIDKHLDLPAGMNYPTIKSLLTHTSGYEREYMFRLAHIRNWIFSNPRHGQTRKKILRKLTSLNLENETNKHLYSNFGYAVAGLILENIHNKEFTEIMNRFLSNDLGLKNTRISDGTGSFSRYRRWQNDNPYLASVGLVSTISDLLLYAEMLIYNNPSFLNLKFTNYEIINEYLNYGLGWYIEPRNNRIFHDGWSLHNSYIFIDFNYKLAIVVLSNLDNNFRYNSVAIGNAIIREIYKEMIE
jgi:CubicO group peptidase (beta-lactamase class C family)